MRKMLALILLLAVSMALFAADSATGSFQISARKPTMSTETGTITAVIYNTYTSDTLDGNESGKDLSVSGTQILVDLEEIPTGGKNKDHIPLFNIEVSGDYIPEDMTLSFHLRPFVAKDNSAQIIPVHFFIDGTSTIDGTEGARERLVSTDTHSSGGTQQTVSKFDFEKFEQDCDWFEFLIEVTINRADDTQIDSNTDYVMTLDAVLTIDGE